MKNKRTPRSADRLIAAIRSAIWACPDQRLGQIIVNAVSSRPSDTTSVNTSDVFYVEDLDLVASLNRYVDKDTLK